MNATVQPTRSRRRWPWTRVVVSLVLGMVTTVGVAWRCAFESSIDDGVMASRSVNKPDPQDPSDGELVVSRWDARGAIVLRADARALHPRPELFGEGYFGPRHLEGVTPEELVPDWAHDDLLPWLVSPTWWPHVSNLTRIVEASGWPLLALTCEREDFEANVRHGIPLQVFRTLYLWEGTNVVLPLRPLWPGFVINSLLFASPWLAITMVPPALITRLRRRRNLCEACAYDRRGLALGAPCPECGALPTSKAQGHDLGR